jgi:predicted GIY-YIG superfamily endonuclease
MNKGRETTIYMIRIDNDIYIGATYNIKNRTNEHNSRKEKLKHRNLYAKILERGVNKVELIEVHKCFTQNSNEKRLIEEEYRIKLKGNLNMYKCYLSTEDRKECDRLYYKINKQIISEKKKLYYQKNRDTYRKKVKCDICNIEMNRVCIKRHNKTIRHLNNIKEQELPPAPPPSPKT